MSMYVLTLIPTSLCVKLTVVYVKKDVGPYTTRGGRPEFISGQNEQRHHSTRSENAPPEMLGISQPTELSADPQTPGLSEGGNEPIPARRDVPDPKMQPQIAELPG